MQLHCYCDNIIDIDVKDEYLLDASTIETILAGDFLSVVCDRCGKEFKPEIPVIFKSKNGEKIHFIPENERFSYSENTAIPKSAYCIIGYAELIEQIAIGLADLKKEVIELVKLQIIQKVPDPSEVVIYFHQMSENNLVFHIHGLKANEVGVMKIPVSLYAAVSKDLSNLKEKEPYKSILQKPYVSLRKHMEDSGEE